MDKLLKEDQVRHYLALRYLEKVGYKNPTKNQIDLFEQYIIDSGCDVFAQYQKMGALAA